MTDPVNHAKSPSPSGEGLGWGLSTGPALSGQTPPPAPPLKGRGEEGSHFRIDTPRLTLRGWRESDIAPFMAHLNTPAVMQWLGGPGDKELYQTLHDRMVECQARHGHCFWIIERKADAAMLGFCGIYRTPERGTPVDGMTEIGWRLREDAWGQGYAREAAEASLNFGFVNQDLSRIIAMTVPQNSASWGLMMRLGMIRARDLDFDHPLVDEPIKHHIIYSIDREDWTQ